MNPWPGRVRLPPPPDFAHLRLAAFPGERRLGTPCPREGFSLNGCSPPNCRRNSRCQVSSDVSCGLWVRDNLRVAVLGMWPAPSGDTVRCSSGNTGERNQSATWRGDHRVSDSGSGTARSAPTRTPMRCCRIRVGGESGVAGVLGLIGGYGTRVQRLARVAPGAVPGQRRVSFRQRCHLAKGLNHSKL